ncbi:DUF6218 family protein [Actinoplanes teichomyceticus]|uniref:Uncharacterized protein n=1 Tax=Actinoplanes teichomyceticus TaxID=1867 RepID=A0A561WKS4_ACTTI|nr:DUF6218 family protein [Actinoplanes teichomyceticus]TWG24472.1 hypothetical protein FHX34_1021028 [Actinoplanes teichomyceticus]
MIASESQDAESSTVLDYLPGVRGHAVLVLGPGPDDQESLAIWTLSALGAATGAWILPLADLDSARLLRIMHMVRGRCLIGWTEDAATEALGEIEALLPAEMIARLRAGRLAIPDLVAEIREHRVHYSEELTAYSASTSSKLAPLKWARELPDEADEADVLTRRPAYAANPAAAVALTLAGTLRQVIDLWRETEEARYRRPYLRSLGELQILPPRWVGRLRAAESGSEG